MTSGGSRVRSGRPAEASEWTTLPAAGRQGPAPEFPLLAPSPRELDLWATIWRSPQSTRWASMDLEAAAYCRCLARAEQPDSKAADWVLVRQAADSLGLSVSGMARYKWRVAPDDSAGEAPAPKTVSARARLRAVASDG